MSKTKYWEYVCDYCGQAIHYNSQAQATKDGWKTRGRADFCSTACWQQSKEHSL